MQNKVTEQITLLQFILLIYKTQIGISVLTLPRVLIQGANTDGWMIVIFGGLLSILLSGAIIRIMKYHPGKILYDAMPEYLGKWLGKVLTLLWTVYALLSATLVLFTSIYIVKVWILPNTPFYLLMIIFIIPIYMVARQGVDLLARYAELVFLVAFLMPYLLFFALKDVEWLNLLPVLKEGWEPVIKSIGLVLPSFYGFELIFIWYPFLKQKQRAFRGAVIANLLAMNILLIITVISFVNFSPVENEKIIWPTLGLLKLIQFPFMERLEVFFLAFYLYVLFATIIPYLFTAVLGLKRLVGKMDHRGAGWGLRLILFSWVVGSVLYFPTYSDLFQLHKIWSQIALYMLIGFIFGYGLYLVLFHWWKRVSHQ